jgi:cytochrome b subunit of formate dehydrogenase
MKTKKLLLFVTFISFIILGISGLIMFFAFEEDVFLKVLGFNKKEWLDYHLVAAVLTVILVFYHVASRWSWVEKYILESKGAKLSKEINKRRFSNGAMMLVFGLSVASGFLSWILSGECSVCLQIHEFNGLLLWLVFGYHIYIHRHAFYSKR